MIFFCGDNKKTVSNLLWKGAPFFQCDANLVSYHGNRVILIATQKKKVWMWKKEDPFLLQI